MFPKSFRLVLYVICGLTLVIFLVVTALSMTVVVTRDPLSLYSHFLSSPNGSGPPLRTIAGVIMVISALKSLCSILSIHGIRKGLPGLLLPFLGYGAFVLIVILISSLLLVISGHLLIAFGLLLCNCVYASGLVKVLKGYESMWIDNGDQQNLLEDTLVEE